jgi:hypothetical protein
MARKVKIPRYHDFVLRERYESLDLGGERFIFSCRHPRCQVSFAFILSEYQKERLSAVRVLEYVDRSVARGIEATAREMPCPSRLPTEDISRRTA